MKRITAIVVERIIEYDRNTWEREYENGLKNKIVAYLKSFAPTLFTSQPTFDAFTNAIVNDADNGYTDGVFTWYAADIYHLEKYNLALTDEFIDYIAAL